MAASRARWAGGGLVLILLGVGFLKFQGSEPFSPDSHSYRILDLSALQGKRTKVFGFNGIGDVVGEYTRDDGNEGAFLWNEEQGLVDLGTLGNSTSRALSVNDTKTVVGYSRNEEGNDRAFNWDPENGMTDLGDLGGERSRALCITPQGTVLGDSATEGITGIRAFLWTEEEGMRSLGTLGGSFSSASMGNAVGDIVGSSIVAGEPWTHGFLWTVTEGMIDLGTLSSAVESSAFGINRHRTIVGSARFENREVHAVVWEGSCEIRDLGTLGGFSSQAFCINDPSQIVGWSETDEGFREPFVLKGIEMWGDLTGHRVLEKVPHAFFFDLAQGRMIDLNDCIDPESGWVLLRALGIDNQGKILTEALYQGTLRTCFLIPLSLTDTDANVK